MNFIQVVQQVIDYIEENLAGSINRGEIAGRLLMTEYNLQAVFSMVCGVTLGEYIRNRRLSVSKDELMSSDINILDIALKYGYNTPDGYTRAFYRYYGITPSAARSRGCKLDSCKRITVQSLFKNEEDRMEKLKERGYSVKGSDLIYYTRDMDKTAKWFRDILGWYAGVDARDDDGSAYYGCAMPFPGEMVHMDLAEFNGLHFFRGEPREGTIGFIRIKGIDNLHKYVTKKGWTEISDIIKQPWDSRTCNVTTIDGCVLMFVDGE